MKHAQKYLILTAAVGMLLLGYQNCGPELKDDASQSSQGGAPFAYSLSVDRVAYMSCASAPNSADFFTLKTAAVDTTKAGVTLTDEFRTAIFGQSLSAMINTLNQDAYNQDARVQFALRPYAGLQGVTTINGGPIYKNVLGPLNQSPIANNLLALKYGEFLNGNQYPLEGDFQLGVNNNQALRDQLNSQTIIMAYTLVAQGTQYYARTLNNQVVGEGYGVNFDCGGTPANEHVLCGVQEYNLTQGVTTGAWDCPSDFQFKIVKNGEAGAAGCNFGGTPQPGTNNFIIYSEAKKILGDNWKIDVTNHCVMPTSGSCYDSNPVDYQLTATCDQAGQPTCARHFSMCLKDN